MKMYILNDYPVKNSANNANIPAVTEPKVNGIVLTLVREPGDEGNYIKYEEEP